jgi:hypothetical protein
MRKRSPSKLRSRREAALRKLADGVSVREVAREAGVVEKTVRKWRREIEVNPLLVAFFGGAIPTKQEMERAKRLWAFALTKVMAEKALQDRDTRACDTVLKLLRDPDFAEGHDDGDGDAIEDRLERELSKLPPDIAAEIVGLLAQAKPAGAGVGGVPGDAAGRKAVGTLQLPWAEDDFASDQGGDGV